MSTTGRLEPVDAALALARSGLPVFACRADKRPATGHGFKDATIEPAAIRTMFRHVNAVLIGVPTGPASGFDVLDIDPRNGGQHWWAAHRHLLPDTRLHRTGSGGLHVLLSHAEPVRNTASKLGQGVDTRGLGGYIIWWPAQGHAVSETVLAPWPTWLLQRLLAEPKPVREVTRTFKPLDGEEAAQRIANRVLSRLASAGDGQRHYTLRKAAYTLGGLLEHLPFGEKEASQRLLRAVQQAGAADLVNAEKTAVWALEKGRSSPLKLREDRP